MPTLTVNHKVWEAMQQPQPIIVIVGGRGCVHPDTLIDTPTGQVKISDFKGGEVLSYANGEVVTALATPAFECTEEDLYMVQLENGSSIIVTDEHKFLTNEGWVMLKNLQASSLVCVQKPKVRLSLLASILGTFLSVFGEGAQRLMGKLSDFQGSCSVYSRLYGQRLLSAKDSGQSFVLQQADVKQHSIHALSREDGQGFVDKYSPSLLFDHVSSRVFPAFEVGQYCEGRGKSSVGIFSERLLGFSRSFLLSLCYKSLEKQARKPLEPLLYSESEKHPARILKMLFGKPLEVFCDKIRCGQSFSFLYSGLRKFEYSKIRLITHHSRQKYWDLHVHVTNNYLSNGIVNHNSGKSLGVGDILTFEMDTRGYDVYCLREFQLSLEDSVHKVFKSAIDKRLKLEGWKVTDTYVQAPNGAKTTYRGAARNPDNIQSAQDYLRSWFEEAHTASEDSIDKLLPTIIRNPGAKCVFTANPQSRNDPFSKRFIVPYLTELERDGVYQDELHYIVKVNWRDNPWWNAEQEKLRKWDFDNLPRAKYDWIWEGQFNDQVDDSLILPEWFDACIDAHKKLGFNGTGVVLASHDPSDQGEDSKGFACRHGSVVIDVQEKESGDVNEGCDWATGLAINHRVDAFTWDCDGMGVSLNRQINDAFNGKGVALTMFKGSESPDHPDAIYEPVDGVAQQKTWGEAVKNKRAQHYLKLRDRMYRTYEAVVKGKYHDPDKMLSLSSDIKALPQLRAEVCRMPVKPNGNGKFELYTKAEMKSKFKFPSPNLADSLMMLMREPAKVISQPYIPRPIKPIGRR